MKKPQTAAPLAAGAYTWYVYDEPRATNVENSRYGTTKLVKGVRFGLRPSSNGKQVRMVVDTPQMGLTKVLTVDSRTEELLIKRSSIAKKGSGAAKPVTLEKQASRSVPPMVLALRKSLGDRAVVYERTGTDGDGSAWEIKSRDVRGYVIFDKKGSIDDGELVYQKNGYGIKLPPKYAVAAERREFRGAIDRATTVNYLLKCLGIKDDVTK